MAKKILIIDDDNAIGTLFCDFFLAQGYEASTAGDAYAGFAAAAKVKPDLIILDMQMPAGGGPAVYRRLKDNTFLGAVPVIFSTSLSKEAAEKALPPGAISQGFIRKPADLDELLKLIDGIIGKP
jgi:DNA-binding response OmpR family regulator